MQKQWSRFLAVMGVSLMLVQIVPGPVALAGELKTLPAAASSVQSLAMPQITLEKAILIVKNNFNVPSEFKDFNSTYNTYNDRQVWALRWNGSEGTSGEFSAEVSALDGTIMSMNYWKNNEPASDNSVVTTISKLDAQKASDALLARLLGPRANELKLIPNDQVIIAVGYGPQNYSFQYQRVINGKPFLGNGVNLQVSSTNAQIISYNLTWNEVKVPEEKAVISADQAKQAFSSSPFFKLQYWAPAPYRPLLVSGQKQAAKLIYQLEGQTGGAIDAYTGKPLQLSPGEWIMTDAYGAGGMGSAKTDRAGSISNGAQVLTPQEQQEVDRNAKLLKQDEAIAVVKGLIEIPDNMSLRSANLSTDWLSIEKRIWSFDWSNTGSDGKEGVPQYISARVSASTGELLGFNASYQQSGKTEAKFDRQAAQKLGEQFLKRVQPDRFSQVVLNSDDDSSLVKIEPEPWTTQSFSYHRVANGIDFPGNGMNINVDPVTGKILSYNLNWSDLELPGVSGILNKVQASDVFLKARPLQLVYIRIYANGMPGDLRLVYLPVSQNTFAPISNIVDAKSGELLDYQGQPVGKGPKPFYFTDLSGISNEREIAALGQAGLFGDFGNEFRPAVAMSLGSLLRAMYLNRFGLYGNMDLTDSEILSKAKEQGWLKEEMQAGDPVNREILTKILLRYIQLNKLADLPNIYHLNYQDAAEISPDALGYFALASSTGILKVEGQVLAPHATVSRVEAAVALFRALGWRIN